MKQYVSFILLICMVLCGCGETPPSSDTPDTATTTAPTTAVTSAVNEAIMNDSHLKILFIGNSFSADTVEYIPDIAASMGFQKVMTANLYIGGASINKHYTNMLTEAASYEYHVNLGSGWFMQNFKSINQIVQSTDWDWICIQHGSADGSKYASEGSYKNLDDLVTMIKELADDNTHIAFNMTWVGEPGSHEELKAFNNDVEAYYVAIAGITETVVAKTEGIDMISATGTAVQNARTADLGLLTRDGYHLSYDVGRYLAGLTFMRTLTGADISDLSFAPEGVSDHAKAIVIEAAVNAAVNPYEVTASAIV